MSHNITIQSSMKDINLLKKALTRMSIRFDTASRTIGGKSCLLSVDSQVGFYKDENKNLTVTGDPYYSSQMKKYYRQERKLEADLLTNYNICQAEDLLKRQGFHLAQNPEGAVNPKTGMIEMVFAR